MKVASYTQYLPGAMIGVYFLSIVLVYRRLSLVSLLISLGAGAITQSLTGSLLYSSAVALFVLFAMTAIMPNEGFIDVTRPLDTNVAKDEEKVRNSTYEGFASSMPSEKPASEAEGFNTTTAPPQISKLVQTMKKLGFSEGFIATAQNVATKGLGKVGSPSATVEGYEDVKVEKNETPAPALKDEKDTMAMPFKLGEIPTQVKNGPHIDAGSTLMQAIKGLNPDQISAMTSDTKQLIETQKSLMGMLGTMKPMLNDGKQLMDTFQQMFG